MSKVDRIEPPSGLSARSRSVWEAEVGPEGRTRSEGRRLMLTECLQAFDRADALREQIEGTNGANGTGKMLHADPRIREELELRKHAAKLALALKLSWDSEVDGDGLGLAP